MTDRQWSTRLRRGRRSRQRTPHRAGRPMRAVAGCDETILALCPEERFKFSGFGIIIIGTSMLAAASMTLALRIVFPSAELGLIAVIGVLWGAFVLALDRWLVSTHTSGRWQLVPRLVIALFFGLIIAEPLVLTAFDDAVTRRLAIENETRVDARRGRLADCNRAATEAGRVPRPAASLECTAEDDLALEPPSQPAVPEMPDNAALIDDVNRLEEELVELGRQLSREIAIGIRSGVPGDGPTAASIRDSIDRVQALLDDRQAALDEVNGARREARLAIATAETRAVTAVADYNQRRSQAIAAEVQVLQTELDRPPGLALRMDTLTDLMWESETILLSRILLTVFLILIDASPAIVRMSTSGGAYESIYRQRAARFTDAGGESVGAFAHRAGPAVLGGHYRSYDLRDPLRPVAVRSEEAGVADAGDQTRPLDTTLIDLTSDRNVGSASGVAR